MSRPQKKADEVTKQDLSKTIVLIRLRHEKPEWRRMMARRMKAMDQGKILSADQLQHRVARG